MNTFVVDSSVIVKWLCQEREQNIDNANKIITQAINGEIELIAPELAKYEIGNVFIKKKLMQSDAKIAFLTLHSLPITFIVESSDIAEQTYSLAKRLAITYYDAAFLSLAKQYNATLVTENVKHQGKSSEVKVTSLEKY